MVSRFEKNQWCYQRLQLPITSHYLPPGGIPNFLQSAIWISSAQLSLLLSFCFFVVCSHFLACEAAMWNWNWPTAKPWAQLVDNEGLTLGNPYTLGKAKTYTSLSYINALSMQFCRGNSRKVYQEHWEIDESLKAAQITCLYRQPNNKCVFTHTSKKTWCEAALAHSHTCKAQFVFQQLKSADTEFQADSTKLQEVTVGNVFCQNIDGSWQCWLARVARLGVIKKFFFNPTGVYALLFFLGFC